MSNTKKDFVKTSKTKYGEKSSGRKKPEENESQMLFESQDNIFQKLSAAFSHSSHSTNIGDMEEILIQAMDIGQSTPQADSEDSCTSYDLRSRTLVKHPRKRLFQTEADTAKRKNDSNNEKCIKNQPVFAEEETDMDCSQESVSMLEELYQNSKNEFPELTETCMNSEFEVISIDTDDEPEPPEVEETVLKVENSTQTNFSVPETEQDTLRETEIAKHADFIKSVVKLKSFLSSKEPALDKNIWSVLQNTIKGEKFNEFSEIQHETIPKETVGYLMRFTDVESVFCETVKTLLQHLDYAFRDDFISKGSFWKDSVYEMAVTMLSEAVDYEVEVWKMVDSFLCEKIGSVLKDAGNSKNLVLEAKTNVIISLCQSTHLSFTATNFIVRKLQKLKKIKPNDEPPTEKITGVYLKKNSYFLLRILESSLGVLKDKISSGKAEEIFVKNPAQKNYNVLEMWKKHWNKNEDFEEKKEEGHDWEVVVSRWCADLDDVLMHCVNYIPVLSMAVERCGILVKEILKLFHPGMVDEVVKTAPSDGRYIEY